jgi:hypothetical protein
MQLKMSYRFGAVKDALLISSGLIPRIEATFLEGKGYEVSGPYE